MTEDLYAPTENRSTLRRPKGDVEKVEVFFRQALEEHEEELLKVQELQKILELLGEPRKVPQIQAITITSNC